jgi:hypothetical protein
MNDESKLPRWARQELDSLRAEVARVSGQLATLRGECEQSDTSVLATGRGRATTDELWLPNGSEVGFYVAGSHGWRNGRVRIDCAVRAGQVRVMGDDSIVVLPQSSNVVTIGAAR